MDSLIKLRDTKESIEKKSGKFSFFELLDLIDFRDDLKYK